MNIEGQLLEAMKHREIRIIAICGAADLGKSYLADRLVESFESVGVSAVTLELDTYLQPREERKALGISGYNPEAYDLGRAKRDIKILLDGGHIENLFYRHDLGCPERQRGFVHAADRIVIDGLHALHASLYELVDFSIFLFASDVDLRKIRREADVSKRKLSLAEAIGQEESEFAAYHKHVAPYQRSCSAQIYTNQERKFQLERTIQT